jgi:hypothetical protein
MWLLNRSVSADTKTSSRGKFLGAEPRDDWAGQGVAPGEGKFAEKRA